MPSLLEAPQNLDAERAVLGCLLLEGAASVSRVAAGLTSSDFFLDRHGVIFGAMVRLQREGHGVDLLTLNEEMRRTEQLDLVGGPAALAFLVEQASMAALLDEYVRFVREAADKRALIALGVRLSHDATDGAAPAALLEQVRGTLATIEARALPGEDPKLTCDGLDWTLTFPGEIRMVLGAIRDGRDGVRGELAVTHGARRLSWGSFALSSTSARETLRKKLDAKAPGLPWGEYLEEAAFRLTKAAREGEPLVALTGTVLSPTRELLPRLLHEGEPTLLYADGDTGKSLVALTVALAIHSGTALPFGLKPARAVPAAYLDWEAGRDTIETRLALLAAGLGIDPPGIFYKRMTRPLVDEAGALAADFARLGIGFVVIDSKMFAVSGGDGAAFHEPITAFYNALRLFAPAASLVVNHVTNADARGGGPARPFGGAFAFNGPRLVWEAKRDHTVTDGTAIVFTCTKANNLPRRPEPFGLLFRPGDGTITVYPFDLTEAPPETMAGASLPYRLRVALAAGPQTLADLARTVSAKSESARKALQRLRDAGKVALDADLYRLTS